MDGQHMEILKSVKQQQQQQQKSSLKVLKKIMLMHTRIGQESCPKYRYHNSSSWIC